MNQEFTGTQQVLAYILEQYGRESLENKSRCLSLFADLAPGLSGQRNLLRNFFDCGGAELAAIKNQMTLNQRANAVVLRMKEEHFIDASAAADICRDYLSVLHMTVDIRLETEQKKPKKKKEEDNKESFWTSWTFYGIMTALFILLIPFNMLMQRIGEKKADTKSARSDPGYSLPAVQKCCQKLILCQLFSLLSAASAY